MPLVPITQFPSLSKAHHNHTGLASIKSNHTCQLHPEPTSLTSQCGGFLSSKWLRDAPDPYDSNLTPSKRKYLDAISTWGTWAEFQDLLKILSEIATAHGVSLTNVATRWVLQQPAVGAVIVGTRLGVSEHVEDNLRVFGWTLSDEDMRRINVVALGADGHKLDSVFSALGDCGAEYR